MYAFPARAIEFIELERRGDANVRYGIGKVHYVDTRHAASRTGYGVRREKATPRG